MLWLRHGDSNTKCFHSFANSRQTINHISPLIINGSACDDQKMIEDEIISFYKRLYTTNQQPAAYFSSWSGKCLSPQKRSWLETPFLEDEIKSMSRIAHLLLQFWAILIKDGQPSTWVYFWGILEN